MIDLLSELKSYVLKGRAKIIILCKTPVFINFCAVDYTDKPPMPMIIWMENTVCAVIE